MLFSTNEKIAIKLKFLADTLRPLNSVKDRDSAVEYIKSKTRGVSFNNPSDEWQIRDRGQHLNICQHKSCIKNFEFAVSFEKLEVNSGNVEAYEPEIMIWVFGYEQFKGISMQITQYKDVIEINKPIGGKTRQFLNKYKDIFPGSTLEITSF